MTNPTFKKFTVSGSENGNTLLAFLAKRMAISSNKAKRLLDDRAVFVNQRRVWMAKHPLQADDHVEVQLAQQAARNKSPDRIRVLFEDDNYLIVDKPAGILSNGDASVETLLHKQLGQPAIQAVHRLDRETSGCLLFAKTEPAMQAMIPVFEKGEVKKRYHAIVAGCFPKTLNKLNDKVEGQQAVTLTRVLQWNTQASLVECRPLTGRTHQIRKHLAAAHFPILGDKQYMTASIQNPVLRQTARQMLHATAISFTSPVDHKAISVYSRFPGDFRACVKLNQMNDNLDNLYQS